MYKMYIYCKRNKYILTRVYGRNNKGHITIRNKQGLFIKNIQLKNINYNYIFKKNILNFNNKILKVQIIKKVIDIKLQRYIYKVICLNSILQTQYKYFPITKNTKEGDIIYIGYTIPLKFGNIMPIKNILCGSWIHNIEHLPTKGAIFVKNSKISAFLIYIGKKYATIKLPSGEIRLLDKNVFCILGELNLILLNLKKIKAGDSRNLGKRPKVRGVAMNACDHPHGGGEGKNSIGRCSAYSPWGVISRGVKTRKNNKYSMKLILKK
uniref:Ribosomal protein L2 n=1 Tax=Cyclospora cayetanensis TaxID=88456 RepID=A0A0K0NTZ3_9EIME|nr:ribosomal protein L2 [Cyclospora cayetanensis]AKO71978.1 ribosomal protein L2 [Cyclospora cayetanensis]ANJ44330.1 ribosomal protein L2 [Cyclospora cayetanensis]ANN13293.1 ribosomal protein L2 [Cyclospora cayetanensis]ANN13322.1 ribosomal protein L2 [Cyclospora cayetanensis]ANN13351.1 ribosomal protein L2 [Cyclospora cayetanensis]